MPSAGVLAQGWADNGNGTLTHTGVTSGTITALAPLANVVAGRVYKTVITMTNAKTIYMFLGGYYSYNFTGNTGTFTFYTIATNTGAPNITAQGANSVTITSISIKEVTNGDLLVYGKARFANAIYNAFGNKVIDINSAGKIGLAGADASNSGYSLVVSGSILASGTNMGMYASFFGAHPNFLRYGTTGIIDHDPGPGNTANLRINTLYGATNYERFSITGVVGNGLNLTAESGGTGAANLNITVSPKGTGYTILNGNVGIGTTTPSAILTIQGTSSSPTTNLLNIASSSGSSIFTVLANGDTYMSNYVGIGVVNTHTAGNLQVAGSGYFSGYFQAGTGMYTGSSNANGAGFKPNGNGLKIVNYSGADSTTTSLTLLGNMGIGTSTPVAKLDITGTAGSADIFAISSSTNTRLFTVAANGNVGIGTTTPGQALTVVGNAQFTAVSSGAYSTDLNLTADGTLTTSASDISLKMNLEALNATSSTSSISILDKVIGLKPYRFNWISDPTGAKDIGLIAQDVEGIFPEITFTNRTDGYKGINYSRLSVILVSAIQELNNKVVQLGSYVVDGVANFASVIATKFTGQEADIKNINTEQICIGETCIDETMLKEIILKNSITDTTSDITEPVAPPTSTSTASTTEPVASSTDPVATSTEPIATSTEPVIEEPAATSTEEVIPVATSTEPII